MTAFFFSTEGLYTQIIKAAISRLKKKKSESSVYVRGVKRSENHPDTKDISGVLNKWFTSPLSEVGQSMLCWQGFHNRARMLYGKNRAEYEYSAYS